MKRLLQTLLRYTGYEIARLDRFGCNPFLDIRRIFRGCPPEVVFDVGANEGQTVTEFVKVFPEAAIHCFEPFRAPFQKLQRLASHFPRVRTVESALGDVDGSQTLYVNSASVTNSLLPNAPEAAGFQPEGMAVPAGTTTIAVSTVDCYCREHGVSRIDILKMDTQGYELNVLRGAEQLIAEGRVAVIFAEVLFAPIYSGQAYFHAVYDHLWTRGFRLANLYGIALNHRNYASWGDALFVHPDVLMRRLADVDTNQWK